MSIVSEDLRYYNIFELKIIIYDKNNFQVFTYTTLFFLKIRTMIHSYVFSPKTISTIWMIVQWKMPIMPLINNTTVRRIDNGYKTRYR